MQLEAEHCDLCTLPKSNATHFSVENCNRSFEREGMKSRCANPSEHHAYIRPITCFACEQVLPKEQP